MERNRNHQFIGLVQAQCAPIRAERMGADEVMKTLDESNASNAVKQVDEIFSFMSDGTTPASSSCKRMRWKRFMEHNKNHQFIGLVQAQCALIKVNINNAKRKRPTPADNVMSTLTGWLKPDESSKGDKEHAIAEV